MAVCSTSFFFSFHSHKRKLSKKKREIVLFNGSDGWLITHHKSSDHLFLPLLFTSILLKKTKTKKKTFYYWNRQYLLRTVQVRRSSPVQNFSYFCFRWQTRRGFLMRSSTFRARSLTDQWHFSNFWRRQKRHLFITLDFDNWTTRLDFLTVDAFLYFSSLVSSFFFIKSPHCIYCHLTNRLALWVDLIDLTIKRDDIIVPYYYFWKNKKKQKNKNKQNYYPIIPFCKGEWLSAWLA